MGVKRLRKIQIGKEVTAGTAVAATTILRLNGTLEDLREQKFSEEDVGILGGTDRSYEVKQSSALEIEGEATFEQLPYILNMGVDEVAGVQDGAGSGYVYSWAFPTTSVTDPASYTIEGGDDEGVEEFAYGIVSEFSLEGAAGEEVKLTANLVGGNASASSFTGSLSLPDVDTIVFGKGRLYIDAVGGTIGTTQVSNQLIGFNLSVTTGFHHRWSADGDLEPSHTGWAAPEITLELTFEHESSSVAEKANWRNQTPRQVRLEFEGPALTTADTHSNKKLRIDLAGKWTKFSKLDENDGNDVVTGTFVARYNSTADLFAEVVIVNELSTLA